MANFDGPLSIDSRLQDHYAERAFTDGTVRDREGNSMAVDVQIGRRQILKGAGAVGAGVVAALAPATVLADNEDNANQLLGTWHAPHTHDTGPFAGITTDGNFTFIPGGGFIADDTDQQATGLGNWVQSGENGFRFTFHTFIFNPSFPSGTKVKVRAQGTHDGDSIRGRFSFQVYLPGGSPVPGVAGTGSFAGARIPVEPV